MDLSRRERAEPRNRNGRARGVSACLAALLALAAPAAAQDTPQPATEAEAAAINMRLAATLCLENLRNGQLDEAFAAAGFMLFDGMDPGSYEATAPGVHAILAEEELPQPSCSVQSDIVDLATANAIGAAITEGRGFTPGSPEAQADAAPGLCDGFTNWDVQPIVTVSYAAAGNSGECIDDGSSAIIIR